MNVKDLLGKRAQAVSHQINLEDDQEFPQLDPSVTPEQAIEASDALEIQLESSLSMLDIVFESAEIMKEAEAIHDEQIENDLIEDPIVTEALNASLDAVSNEIVEPVTQSEEVAMEADNLPATTDPTPTAGEAQQNDGNNAAGNFKARLQKWKKQIVEFIIKIKDWFINLITNYEKLGVQLKAKAEELVSHFTSGTEFKFTVKSASVVGDKNVGSPNDITATVKNAAANFKNLAAKTRIANNPEFQKEELSFDLFGGKAVLTGGDFKFVKSNTDKKEVELTMTGTVAAQLKSSCDSLATIFETAVSAKKTMADAARAAETELRKTGGYEENKDQIKQIRNTVVFINTVYKLAAQQAKLLLSEVLPVRTEKKQG